MERLLRIANRLVGWLALALILVPLFVYRMHFGPNLSNTKSDFGTFGDFMNPFLALASILLLGYISLQTFITTRRFNDIQLRPHLFLEEVPSTIPLHPLIWKMNLVSQAPAVNIFLRVDLGNSTFTKWILCPPLSIVRPKLKLPWIRQAAAIEVMYSDITGQNLYAVRIEGRLHRIAEVDDQDFESELNRVRQNNDFHIGLDSLYRSIFTNPANTMTYTNFAQQNLIN